MVAPSRPVRVLIGSLGVFLLAPAVVTLLATAFGHQLPGSTLLGAALAFLIAAGYVWFWFFARDELTRLLIAALVVLLTCVSSVLPESPLVLFFRAYPALLIGFALRPLRAIVATVILI